MPPQPSLVPVAISLGSNLGDRRGHLAFAVQRLAEFLEDLRASSVRETEPVDVADDQPPYLNSIVVGRTRLTPHELLGRLLAIESARRRARPFPRAPRTLDLDLILFGDRVIATAELSVPHPRFRARRFVLEPLAELAPDWLDPISGKSARELLDAL